MSDSAPITPDRTVTSPANAQPQGSIQRLETLVSKISEDSSKLIERGNQVIADINQLLESEKPVENEIAKIKQGEARFGSQLSRLNKNLAEAKSLFFEAKKEHGHLREGLDKDLLGHAYARTSLEQWQRIAKSFVQLAESYVQLKANDKKLAVIYNVFASNKSADFKERAERTEQQYRPALERTLAAHKTAANLLTELLRNQDTYTEHHEANAASGRWRNGGDYERCMALLSAGAALSAKSALKTFDAAHPVQVAKLAAFRAHVYAADTDLQYVFPLLRARQEALDLHPLWESVQNLENSATALRSYWESSPYERDGKREQAPSARHSSRIQYSNFKNLLGNLEQKKCADLFASIRDHYAIGTHLQQRIAGTTRPGQPVTEVEKEVNKQLRELTQAQIPGLLSSLKKLLNKPGLLDADREKSLIDLALPFTHAHLGAAKNYAQHVAKLMKMADFENMQTPAHMKHIAFEFAESQRYCKTVLAMVYEDFPPLRSSSGRAKLSEKRRELTTVLRQNGALCEHMLALVKKPAYLKLPQAEREHMQKQVLQGFSHLEDVVRMVAPAPKSETWEIAERILLTRTCIQLLDTHTRWIAAQREHLPVAELRTKEHRLLRELLEHSGNMASCMKKHVHQLRAANSSNADSRRKLVQYEELQHEYKIQHVAARMQIAQLDLLIALDNHPNLQKLYSMLIRRMHDLNRELTSRASGAKEHIEIRSEVEALLGDYEQLALDIESFGSMLAKKDLSRHAKGDLDKHVNKLKDLVLAQCTETARELGLDDAESSAPALPEDIHALHQLAGQPALAKEEANDNEHDIVLDPVTGFRQTTTALNQLRTQTEKVQARVDALKAEAMDRLAFATEMAENLGNPRDVQEYFELASACETKAARSLRKLAAQWASLAPGGKSEKAHELSEQASQLEEQAVKHRERGRAMFIHLTKERPPTGQSLSRLLEHDEIARVERQPRNLYIPRNKVTGKRLLDQNHQPKIEWMEQYVITLRADPGQQSKRWAVHVHYPDQHSERVLACHVKTYEDRLKGAGYESDTGNAVYRSRLLAATLERLQRRAQLDEST